MTITDEMDIAGLIERLKYPISDWKAVTADMRKAAAALSRLTAQPLPDEIATIVGQLENWKTSVITSDAVHVSTHTLKKAAAIIRAVALENERLTERHNKFAEDMALNTAKLTMRIVEIVNERDELAGECKERRAEWVAAIRERDAIKLKTIEECAEIAAKLYGRGRDLPAIIRALAQGKEEET